MGKIVVTPGAGAGVGRATIIELAQNGCDVAPFLRNPERLESVALEARRFGVRALPIPTDVADADAVEAAATRVEQEFGPIGVAHCLNGAVTFPTRTASKARRRT